MIRLEPLLLPVKPGSLNTKDKAELRKTGVLVIEHDNPAELRLLKPHAELDANDMLRCAMKALCSNTGVSAQQQRECFTNLLAAAIDTKDQR